MSEEVRDFLAMVLSLSWGAYILGIQHLERRAGLRKEYLSNLSIFLHTFFSYTFSLLALDRGYGFELVFLFLLFGVARLWVGIYRIGIESVRGTAPRR